MAFKGSRLGLCRRQPQQLVYSFGSTIIWNWATKTNVGRGEQRETRSWRRSYRLTNPGEVKEIARRFKTNLKWTCWTRFSINPKISWLISGGKPKGSLAMGKNGTKECQEEEGIMTRPDWWAMLQLASVLPMIHKYRKTNTAKYIHTIITLVLLFNR